MTPDQLRMLKVLERIRQNVIDDHDDAQAYCEIFEGLLNELQAEDFFGTEGQSDPRGDFRDDCWSMQHVQGVDA